MNGWLCGTGSCIIRLSAACDVRFIAYQLRSPRIAEHLEQHSVGVTMKNLNHGLLNALLITLPPLAIQRQVVAEIEAERALVEANRKLVEIFEQKIQAKLAEIWGKGIVDC